MLADLPAGRRVAAAALAGIPESAAALVGLAGIVPAVLVWPSSRLLGALLLVLGLALALAGAVGGLVIGFARRAIRALPENGYGLCSGTPGVVDRESPALTPWLTRFINEVAGKPMSAGPLTFGDLWDAGRPYRLPFRERVFFYDPDEWAALFPAEVIRWMNEHPRHARRAGEEDPVSVKKAGRLRPLPDTKDLPVVVATRLSLGFPFLLSAVPLYAVDYTRANEQDRVPERCWFSDGGLTSNFPVHFFDAPLPRRPTFGINLRPHHPDYPRNDTWMPDTVGGGVNESRTGATTCNSTCRDIGSGSRTFTWPRTKAASTSTCRSRPSRRSASAGARPPPASGRDTPGLPRLPGQPPVPCHPLHGQASPESVLGATEQLLALPAEWQAHGVDFGKASHPPRPNPELRIVPRI